MASIGTELLTDPLRLDDAGMPPEPWRDRLFWNAFSRLPVFTILFEDTDVEARYFQVDETSRVLSVAAAGCGIASLLAHHPEHIDAVDGNPHHLALTGLKVAAAQRLSSHAELYDLFGHGRHAEPRAIAAKLTRDLPPWMQSHWARRHGVFRRGVYGHGLSPRMFATMRLAAGVDEAWMRRLAAQAPVERAAEVERVYQRLMALPMVALAARSPLLLLTGGINFRQRDRNLASCGTSDMAAVGLESWKRAASTDVETNWILWHTFAGTFNHAHPAARPPYLREAQHARSFGAPTTTAYHLRSFVEVLADAGERTWTHYSFSDALDWLAEPMQRRVLGEVLRTSRPGALLINRSVEATCLVSRLGLDRFFTRLDQESDEATAMERSGLYRRVDLYRVNG